MNRTLLMRGAGVAIAVAILVSGSPAGAEPSAADRAAADSLFNDGQKLMQAGKPKEACPKFEASEKLDPAIGTLLNLGDCYEKAGRTASAWATFNDARTMAEHRKDPEARWKEAERRATLLEPRLSRLQIDASTVIRVEGLVIQRDGAAVDKALWGMGIPVDPGEHAIEVSAPGKQKWSSTVRVDAAAGTVNVAIPELIADMGVGSTPVVSNDEARPFWSAPRIAGVAVGGVGVIGLVVGGVFGAQAISKKNASNANGHCDAKDFCDKTGKGLRSDSLGAATVSTVAFIAGGVLAVGGVVLVVAGPRGKKANVALGVGPTGVTLGGSL